MRTSRIAGRYLTTARRILRSGPHRRTAIAAAAVVVALVAGLTVIVPSILSTPGGQTARARQPAPSVSLWQLAPPTSAQAGTFDYAAAVLRIKQQGYTVLSGPAPKGSPGPFRVFVAVCTGSVDGYCLRAFFFHNGDLVADIDARTMSIHAQNGRTITLDFPQYGACDPLGDPSLGTKTIIFQWNGTSVVPNQTLPSDLNNTYGDPNDPNCASGS